MLRARVLLAATFAAVAIATVLLVPNGAPSVAAQSDDPPPAEDVTVDTANPFLPEDRDITECIGMLQRPGCGSEARGGWHQNAVAIAMIGGLVIVFGRVAYGVRKNRQRSDTPS